MLKEIRPLKCPEHVFTPIMNNEFFDEKENIFAADSDTHKQKLVRELIIFNSYFCLAIGKK